MKATDGETTIEIADNAIRGEHKNKDGSYLFQCLGGPYHGMKFRSYDLSEPLVFNTPHGKAVYEVHPPAKAGGKWKYVHNPLAANNA